MTAVLAYAAAVGFLCAGALALAVAGGPRPQERALIELHPRPGVGIADAEGLDELCVRALRSVRRRWTAPFRNAYVGLVIERDAAGLRWFLTLDQRVDAGFLVAEINNAGLCIAAQATASTVLTGGKWSGRALAPSPLTRSWAPMRRLTPSAALPWARYIAHVPPPPMGHVVQFCRVMRLTCAFRRLGIVRGELAAHDGRSPHALARLFAQQGDRRRRLPGMPIKRDERLVTVAVRIAARVPAGATRGEAAGHRRALSAWLANETTHPQWPNASLTVRPLSAMRSWAGGAHRGGPGLIGHVVTVGEDVTVAHLVPPVPGAVPNHVARQGPAVPNDPRNGTRPPHFSRNGDR